MRLSRSRNLGFTQLTGTSPPPTMTETPWSTQAHPSFEAHCALPGKIPGQPAQGQLWVISRRSLQEGPANLTVKPQLNWKGPPAQLRKRLRERSKDGVLQASLPSRSSCWDVSARAADPTGEEPVPLAEEHPLRKAPSFQAHGDQGARSGSVGWGRPG